MYNRISFAAAPRARSSTQGLVEMTEQAHYPQQFNTIPQQSHAIQTMPSMPPAMSSFAIAAFVLGVVGAAPLAVIFGHLALRDIKVTERPGRGLALAGTILGWVVIGIWALALIMVVSMLNAAG